MADNKATQPVSVNDLPHIKPAAAEFPVEALARDYWARDVVFHHQLPEQPGDDHYATIAKALAAALAAESRLRAQLAETTRLWHNSVQALREQLDAREDQTICNCTECRRTRARAKGAIPDPWRCKRCGSDRWVSASLTGPVVFGGRGIRQCIPCGHYSGDAA